MERNHAEEQKGILGKKKTEDRIGELPDDVLLHILSFLPTYQTIRTSILSSRWRDLWTRVPVLDFSTHEPVLSHWEIQTVISFCLMLWNAPKIKKFHVRVDHARIPRRYLDAWLRFASQHGVEELDMDYFYGGHYGNVHNLLHYPMPGFLWRCGALRALRLRGCRLQPPPSFYLGSLRTMELYHVVILSDLDTSGFPLLESLTLYGCNPKSRLSIYSPNQKLENLRIYDASDVLRGASEVKIDAPYLLSLQIGGYMREFGYSIKDLSSVTHASLDFTRMFERYRLFLVAHVLLKLIESLGHVKTLKLCQWCIQDATLWGMPGLENSSFSPTCLDLGINLNRWDIKGMSHLLSSSHYLETLILDFQAMFGCVRRSCGIDESEGWKMLELAMSSLLHLKTVRIYNLFGSGIDSYSGDARIAIDKILSRRQKEIKLLKVVLKSNKMMEKMFISTISTPDPTKWMILSELLLILTEELLNFPRASANAEIYLS